MYEHKIPASEDGSHDCGVGVGCHLNYLDGDCDVANHWHFKCEPALLSAVRDAGSDLTAMLAVLAEPELNVKAALGGGLVVLGCDNVSPVAYIGLAPAQVDQVLAARSSSAAIHIRNPTSKIS